MKHAMDAHSVDTQPKRAGQVPSREMKKLDRALAIALNYAEGDEQAFAFQLSAAIAGWMSQNMLTEKTALASIELLHRLHPDISV